MCKGKPCILQGHVGGRETRIILWESKILVSGGYFVDFELEYYSLCRFVKSKKQFSRFHVFCVLSRRANIAFCNVCFYAQILESPWATPTRTPYCLAIVDSLSSISFRNKTLNPRHLYPRFSITPRHMSLV